MYRKNEFLGTCISDQFTFDVWKVTKVKFFKKLAQRLHSPMSKPTVCRFLTDKTMYILIQKGI